MSCHVLSKEEWRRAFAHGLLTDLSVELAVLWSDITLLLPFIPLNADLNPICHLLALVGAHHILYVSRIRVNLFNSSSPVHKNTTHKHYTFVYFFIALFCTLTNKCTIISQIITLLHVSTLSCHPQTVCNQYLANLHKYFKCSCR